MSKEKNIFWNKEMKNLESNFRNKSHSFWSSWKEFQRPTTNSMLISRMETNGKTSIKTCCQIR